MTHPLAPRIKKMMQADEDVGKIAQAAPVLLGMPALSQSLKDIQEYASHMQLCTVQL